MADEEASEERPVVSFFVEERHRFLLKHAPPVPAGRAMPQWLRDTDNHFTKRTKFQVFPPELKLRENATVKSCPGIVDYLTGGYVIPLWADYAITFDNGVYRWESPQDDWPLVAHDPGQYEQMPREGFPLVIKFQNPWYIKTPPGYSVRMLPMLYHFDQLWKVLSGVIHTDVFNEAHVNVQFDVRKGQVVLPQGMPLCHIVPFHRERYEVDIRTGTAEEIEQITDTRRQRGRIFSDPDSYPRLRGET